MKPYGLVAAARVTSIGSSPKRGWRPPSRSRTRCSRPGRCSRRAWSSRPPRGEETTCTPAATPPTTSAAARAHRSVAPPTTRGTSSWPSARVAGVDPLGREGHEHLARPAAARARPAAGSAARAWCRRSVVLVSTIIWSRRACATTVAQAARRSRRSGSRRSSTGVGTQMTTASAAASARGSVVSASRPARVRRLQALPLARPRGPRCPRGSSCSRRSLTSTPITPNPALARPIPVGSPT